MKIKVTPKMMSRLSNSDKDFLRQYISHEPNEFNGFIETKELDEAMNVILRIKDAVVFKEMYASNVRK